MREPQVHRTRRHFDEYPPLLLAPGSRVLMWPEYTGPPSPDDEFAPPLPMATVMKTDVHQNNPDFVWGYVLHVDDDAELEMRGVKSIARVLSLADWPDAY